MPAVKAGSPAALEAARVERETIQISAAMIASGMATGYANRVIPPGDVDMIAGNAIAIARAIARKVQ